MRRVMNLGLSLAGALAFAGCASSGRAERKAELHEQSAQRAAASGDYVRAATEQRRADDERRKAERRAVEEREQMQPQPYTTPSSAPIVNPTAPPPGAPY